MIIGSGVFLKPGIVLLNAGSPVLSILAWVAGGVITLASALSISEIASRMPRTGGLFAYLEELYGKRWGFLLGWVQTVISYPASIAAQAIAFSTYASFFVPLGTWAQKGLAIAVMAFLLIMNIIATKCGGVIQTIATVAKLIPIAAIILFGFFSPAAPGFGALPAFSQGAGFGAAILGTLWAYDGWIGVTNMAGELKNPKRQLPKVITVGVIFVIAVYALINLAIFRCLPYEQIMASETPGADAAVVLFGAGGAAFIAAGIMISVFGALNGYLMTAARVPFAMGERKQLPFSKLWGRLHPKLGTPANSLILESALATIYILTGSFNTLTDLLVFVLWIFFTLGVFGVFLMRKRYGVDNEGYKVPLFPLTPIVGILGGLYILGSTVVSEPLQSLIGVALTLIGIPVYAYMNRKTNKN